MAVTIDDPLQQPTPAAAPAVTSGAPPPPSVTTATPVPPVAAPPAGGSLYDRAATQQAGPAPAPFTPKPYDETGSVEQRAARIVGSGSPLMQLAETRGIQDAAKRGLTNSSIGIESAQQAVLGAAVPIASADAGLATQTQNVNTQVQGSMAMQQADIGQKMRELETQREQFAQSLGMTGKDLELRRDTLTQNQQQFLASLDQQKQQLAQQESQFGRSLQANQGNFQAELAQRDVLARLDAATREKLGQLDASSRVDVQNNANIAQAWGQMMSNIANIQNNANLEEGAKTTLINNNLAAFSSFSNFWKKLNGGGIDVSDLLNFGAAGAAPAPEPPRNVPRWDEPIGNIG